MSYAQAMRFNRKHPKGTRPFGKGPMLRYAAETKHTPGPWEAMQNVGLCDAWVRGPSDSEGRGDICHLSEWQTEARQIANAQLIAAAPALLEVCRAMATEIDRFCAKNNIGGGFGVTHKAWAVIAAAG